MRLAFLLTIVSPLQTNAATEFELDMIGVGIRFQEPDARGIAMGTAVTAIVEGPTAAYWNLGGLGMPSPLGSVSYSTREVSSARYHFVSAAGSRNGIGVGGHLTGTRENDTGRAVYRPGEVTFESSNYFGFFAAGIDMKRLVGDLPERMAWGAGLGVGMIRCEWGDYDGDGWDMDFGTLLAWRLPIVAEDTGTSVTLRTGYVLRNMWNRKMSFGKSELSLGREDRIGIAAVLESSNNALCGPILRGTASWERRGLFAERGRHSNRLGGEITVAGLLSLRAGHIWDSYTLDRDRSSWGAGFGLRPGNTISPRFGVQLDYVDADNFPLAHIEQFTASIWFDL
jgi:hypothetical protein